MILAMGASFTVLIVFPGALAFCLMLFDGRFRSGFSWDLLKRSIAWGAFVSVAYAAVMWIGGVLIGPTGVVERGSRALVFALLYLLCPALFLGYGWASGRGPFSKTDG